MVANMMIDESYELEDAATFHSSESRGKFERSSKSRFNTRARYARGKGGPTLSGAHRRRAKKSYS